MSQESTASSGPLELPGGHVDLPDWVPLFLSQAGRRFPTTEDRMGLVVELARRNVEQGTGGPFGAAVFDQEGCLVAPGINLVYTAQCSVLHAEIVALILAHRAVGRYDLSDGGRGRYDLVASTEPCTMCLGATIWSGVSRLACGARDEDARAVGFDEGPEVCDWVGALTSRGIAVVRDVLREQAAGVLRAYAAAGGLIYNAGRCPGERGTIA